MSKKQIVNGKLNTNVIVYRAIDPELEEDYASKPFTGIYTTSQKKYAKEYLYSDGRLVKLVLMKGLRVYEARDVEDLHEDLYGKEILRPKSCLHGDWIDSLRKAEAKIAKKLSKEGYDLIYYENERYDCGYSERNGELATSFVILNKEYYKGGERV